MRRKKNRTMIGVDSEDAQLITKLSLEISELEGRRVSNREVIRRILKGEDTELRLKIGAKERKMGLRK